MGSLISGEKNVDLLEVFVFGENININFLKNVLTKQKDENIIKENVIKHANHNFSFHFQEDKIDNDCIKKLILEIKNGFEKEKDKNVVIFFLDSIHKNQELISLIFNSFSKIEKIYYPKIIFAINYDKNNLNELDQPKGLDMQKHKSDYSLVEEIIQKNYYDIRDISIIYYSNNDFSGIHAKILEIAEYYNNTGDIISYPEQLINYGICNYIPKKSELIKYKATFNILVVGRPGVGKSSLINILLGKKKCREGIGKSITAYIAKYVHDEYPITLFDTPGFEDDNQMKKLIEYLKKYNELFNNGKNQFHLVLYLINGSSSRCFTGNEKDIIQVIQKLEIPIFFVATKCMTQENAINFKEVIRICLIQLFGENTTLINNIYCCHLINEKDGKIKKFNLDNILYEVYDKFKENIIDLDSKEKILDTLKNKEYVMYKFINNIKDIKNLLETRLSKIITDYAFLAEDIGSFLLPSLKVNQTDGLFNLHAVMIEHLGFEMNISVNGKEYLKERNENISENKLAKVGIAFLNAFKLFYFAGIGLLAPIIEKTYEHEKTKNIGLRFVEEKLAEMKEKGYEEYLKEIVLDYNKSIESFKLLSEKHK